MKNWRRYEILLPLYFNDDSPVPRTLIAETIEELENRFGAVSSETQIIQGRWQSGGKHYSDELVRIWVDAEETDSVKAFFAELKEKLKARFEQLDIWMVSYSVNVI